MKNALPLIQELGRKSDGAIRLTGGGGYQSKREGVIRLGGTGYEGA